ncbi:MAG: hypothetical protein RR543_02730 [Erysipelotrichales bacterium]
MKKIISLIIVFIISGCASNSLVDAEKVSDDQKGISTIFGAISLNKAKVNIDKMAPEKYTGFKMYGEVYKDKKLVENKEVYEYKIDNYKEKDLPKYESIYTSISRNEKEKFQVNFGVEDGVGYAPIVFDKDIQAEKFKSYAQVETKVEKSKENIVLLNAISLNKDNETNEPSPTSNLSDLNKELNSYIVVYIQFY